MDTAIVTARRHYHTHQHLWTQVELLKEGDSLRIPTAITVTSEWVILSTEIVLEAILETLTCLLLVVAFHLLVIFIPIPILVVSLLQTSHLILVLVPLAVVFQCRT